MGVVEGFNYFQWSGLFVILLTGRQSDGFQMAFFKYADTDPPYFFLTETEIKKAAMKDERWKDEADNMNLLSIWSENAVTLPHSKEEQGLEMEVFNMALRHYNCE